jgi:23S rRNA (adenine-N6)-dimethyltransferase
VSAERRTHWGWHRLADRFARRLVVDARIEPGDLVLDIGAGDGALTAPLVAVGARVVAVELHPARARTLRQRFSTAPVVVVQCDARDLRLPRRPFRVVANPPFAVTTALLRRLLADGSALVSADLVVPRHVARRWASARAPGSVRWTRTFAVTLGPRVPSHAFCPPPKVPIECLRIRRRES